ncbi:MAG TPA: helix-turn-helix domain-containing protein [Acidothermaceae bacterium]|nr:helix-turn-helix domain-containing protein [Acidothermaceae bacterium]
MTDHVQRSLMSQDLTSSRRLADEQRRQLFIRAVAYIRAGLNPDDAAKALGISRAALERRLDKLNR